MENWKWTCRHPSDVPENHVTEKVWPSRSGNGTESAIQWCHSSCGQAGLLPAFTERSYRSTTIHANTFFKRCWNNNPDWQTEKCSGVPGSLTMNRLSFGFWVHLSRFHLQCRSFRRLFGWLSRKAAAVYFQPENIVHSLDVIIKQTLFFRG